MAVKKTDPLLKKESKGIFNQYLNRSDIGGEMLRSFLNNEANKNPEGFLFGADSTRVGILSQCYGILTLAEYSKFDIDLGANKEVAEKVNAAFNDVLDKINADSDELVFGATPYVSEESDVKVYIETVALVLRVAIEIRRLLIIDFDNDRNTIEVDNKYVHASEGLPESEVTLSEIAFTENLIAKCIDVLTGSALKANGDEGLDYCLRGESEPLYDRNGKNMQYKGWTFTSIPEDKHDKTETSLYFTYLVCDAYLAFYEAFEKAIKLVRKMRDNLEAAKNDPERNVSESENVENADPEKYGIDLSRFDDQKLRNFNFIKRIYHRFSKFNKVILDAGHYVDTKFSDIDITKDFFSYNFKLVTAQNIEESKSNDAMFNVLFSVNIMMAAGVDLDYQEKGKEAEFYDALQYSVPNIQRLYKKLVRAGKEYICEQYIVTFNENMPSENTESPSSVFYQAKLLRKRFIIALNLMPLIIKTYNVLSKFLTPYPQYEMRIYKDYILQNKMENEWLWDKEGYQLINNFNYVLALRNFYDYYEEYEKPYALDKLKYIAEKNAELENLEVESARKLQRQRALSLQEIETLKQRGLEEIEALKRRYDGEIAELKAEKAELEIRKSPIEEEIIRILTENIDGIFVSVLNKIIAANGRTTYDDEDLQTVFKRAFVSYFSSECDRALDIFEEVADESHRPLFIQQNKDTDHIYEKKVFKLLCQAVEFINAKSKS